ncbi:MAG: penicillin-binding protein, partial [Treponema sp.]|nr:penicillin-binding protein [Treponema sp.]
LQSEETPNTVVAQDPQGGMLVSLSTRVSITMTSPDSLSTDNVFGLFKYDMAKNPYPLLVRLESILPGGERRQLLSVHYSGGRLTVPYLQPPGAVLVLYLLNREIYRETVPYGLE